jgi:hypothetical protein
MSKYLVLHDIASSLTNVMLGNFEFAAWVGFDPDLRTKLGDYT